MRIYHRELGKSEAEKAIDDYISNPESGINNVICFLRDKKISFKDIPKAKQTRELLIAYLDMPEITFVRAKWISKKLLDDETWRKIAAKCKDYEDIPTKYLTEANYYDIVKSEYYAVYKLNLIPAKKMTEELLIEALATSFDCLHHSELNKSILGKFDIRALKREALKLRSKRKSEQEKSNMMTLNKYGWIIYNKGYDTEKKKFCFSGKPVENSEAQNLEFRSFDKFYNFMLEILPEERRNSAHPQPLDGIDLMNVDFKDTDLSRYDMSGCFIRTEFLDKSHCFIDIAPKILDYSDDTENDIREDVETALVSYGERAPVYIGDVKAKSIKRKDYYYISDIHLTHRILNQLGRRFTKEQVTYLILGIVNNISNNGITLIAGDIGENFGLNKMFYLSLSEKSHGVKVITLGNHELWDDSLYKESPVDDVVDAYRQIFDGRSGLILLQNELLIENDSLRYILSEKDILEKSDAEIADLCEDADTIILGGIGFTGYCNDKDPKTGMIYNAEYGLYRSALKTIDDDIKQTQRFEAVYDKVRKALSDCRVIILTHTPKECWSKEPYLANWVYVNGHTHRNIEIVNEEKMLFADNQIGYHNENVQLKEFTIIRNMNLFCEHLEDGIHEITVQQYREIFRSKGLNVHVNAGIGTIVMIKKQEQYMFLLRKFIKSANGDKLYILDGGAAHTADFDERYYYDNMDIYVTAVKSIFKNYWSVQNKVAYTIKRIGGEGIVHGCIVDIDYYNHAYLNPFDGTLTFYYAESINDKYVYDNIEALLQNQAKKSRGEDRIHYLEMEKSYKRIISKMGEENLQTASTPPVFVGSTEMYRVSRVIKRMQYIADSNIVRAWHDGVLNYYKSRESNQLMDFKTVFSLKEIEDKYEID